MGDFGDHGQPGAPRDRCHAAWAKVEVITDAGSVFCASTTMERYSKPHMIEKKNSPQAASNASS